MFIYKTSVKMHHTDAAGILFFGSQFWMIHDAYEAFLESIDFGFAKLLKETNFFVPIVHAEADYKQPLFVGDKLTITVEVKGIGQTSFAMSYTLRRKGQIVGLGKTIHVSVNSKTKKKIPIPQKIKSLLKKQS